MNLFVAFIWLLIRLIKGFLGLFFENGPCWRNVVRRFPFFYPLFFCVALSLHSYSNNVGLHYSKSA